MKMTNEIRIKMAETEGWEHFHAVGIEEWWEKAGEVYLCSEVPTYDNDNDLDRFIRGMHPEYQIAYEHEIIGITATVGMLWCEATEEQKQEAIVKVKGWEVPV